MMSRLSEKTATLGRYVPGLADIDLEPLVSTWHGVLTTMKSHDTASHYLRHVRSLIPKDKSFARSQLTPERLQQWIDELDASSATKRKAGAAMSSFTSWLARRKLAQTNLMREVALPPAGKPRIHYLETDEAKKLAHAQPEPYRSSSALLAGSGIEVSAALKLRRRDIDVKNCEIRAAGTKTHSRDRVVRIAEWAAARRAEPCHW